MAEGLLFHTVRKILDVLASQIFQEIELAYGVKDEIAELKDTVESIHAVLLDAEEQQNRKNHAVMIWLRRLKDTVCAAEDLLDDFSTEFLRRQTMNGNKAMKEVRIFFSKYNQLAYALDMGHKIKSIRQRLESVKNARQFHLTENIGHLEPRVENTRRETHSFVQEKDVIGRENDKNEIISQLLHSNDVDTVSVISIVGMGGLGKTTVAQLVYNDEKVGNYFDLRMWVCVSDVFDITTIVEKLIKSATNSECQILALDQLQSRFRQEIDGKKYLLVLDDVWNENRERWLELETLLMNGARGSKVIVTTRSERVAEITSKLPFHVLQGLSEDMFWSLFSQMAFQRVEPRESNLVQIGKDIVAKCVGVPLAIRTIGRLLYYNKTETYWLHIRDNELSKISQEETDILPKLKLSYDHLPSPLKQCFAYCALFPKDYEIKKEQLILLWMAEGFLGSSLKNQCLQDVGNEYFMSLLSRSFFQDVEYNKWGDIIKCKIHDLMHDLAESVAGIECVKVELDARNVDERTHHLSFVSDLCLSWKFPTALLKLKHLRSFLLPTHSKSKSKLSEFNCNKILSSFQHLRTLNLSNSGIESVPRSIGKLKHLRYLNLSFNIGIKKIPNSVSRLCNLETLDISSCNSHVKLPRDFRKFLSLRYFIFNSMLSSMPNGLGMLTSLRTLPLFIVGRRATLSELQELNNLRGYLGIMNLGDMQNSRLANLEAKEYLQSLDLIWNPNKSSVENDEALLDGLKPHQNLKNVFITYFGGVRLSSWLSSLSNLTRIQLYNCERCRYIPQLDQLPCLKTLSFFQFHGLEYVSSSSTPSRIIFPSLEKLIIIDCPKLKGWWNGSTIQMAELYSFPCLSVLMISRCPELNSMPFYPSLEALNLQYTSLKPFQETIMLTTCSSEAPPFSKLKYLNMEYIDDLETWPEVFQTNFTSIVKINISSCPKLVSLPRWLIKGVSNRPTVKISNCLNLTIVPEEMPLQRLEILECSQLSERCGNSMAVDWPKIAHIPDIQIDWNWIQKGGVYQQR